MKGCLEINYEPPDGLLLSGRFCVGAGVVGMLTKLLPKAKAKDEL